MHPEDKVVTYGIPELALLSTEPEHYYYMNLSRAALWDIDLFHRYQLPDWDTIVQRDKPRFVVYRTVYDHQHHPDWPLWKPREALMGIDKAFLEQYYISLPDQTWPLWMRKD